MKLPGYYSSGQFARMAQVSVRTIRFYDKQNILKPSYVNPNGARFYTDSDLAKLQQILLLKYLGFSLDEIKDILVDDLDSDFLRTSLQLQKKLVQDRIEQMQLVEEAITKTASAIDAEHAIDWSNMLHLIHLTGMEKSLKTQYQNAGNISARIRLHRDYSTNRQGWFPWLFEQAQMAEGMTVLELGCGNGAFWTENLEKLPQEISILVSDLSEGMLRDARRSIGTEDARFQYTTMDAGQIPFPDDSFDLIIANHVLFYCDDIEGACKEIARVLKAGGRLLCSAYGPRHMREVTELVQEFDNRIVLAAENLFDRFGLENGQQILASVFSDIRRVDYEDSIILNQAEPLVDYILSCHGNQNQYLLDHYKEFRSFVEKKTRKQFTITKDAGAFICTI